MTTALFVGRFQPFHIGHKMMVDRVLRDGKQCIICIVDSGKLSSRNPFDYHVRAHLIESIYGDRVVIIRAANGYIPDIILDNEIHVDEVYAGKDRRDDFKKQIEAYNTTADKPLNIKIRKATPRATSATQVRGALEDGDRLLFESLMPSPLWKNYDSLARLFAERIQSEDSRTVAIRAERSG